MRVAPQSTDTLTDLMKRPWKDISVALQDSMIHWPGDPECRVSRVLKMEEGAVCNLTQLSLCAHTGTHMDAPRHFIADGATMDQMPFEPVIGRCRLIEVPTTGDQITAEDLQKFKFSRGQRVLLKTRNSAEKWAEKPFNKDFVSIRADAAQLLVDQGVMTVGVDYLSVGGYERDGVQTHQILLGAGVWVIEGLDLSEAKPGYYNLICLPLKLAGADGAPCRVVIR